MLEETELSCIIAPFESVYRQRQPGRARSRRLTMAQQGGVMPGSGSSGSLSWMPLVVSALVVAHVFALVFWIYKLATDKPEDRRKVH